MEQQVQLATDYDARIRPYLEHAGQLGIGTPPLKRHKSQVTDKSQVLWQQVGKSFKKPLHKRQGFQEGKNDPKHARTH